MHLLDDDRCSGLGLVVGMEVGRITGCKGLGIRGRQEGSLSQQRNKNLDFASADSATHGRELDEADRDACNGDTRRLRMSSERN